MKYSLPELIETPLFSAQVSELLSDEEYRVLQIALVSRPDLGALIPGSGGLRKLRWSMAGRGKRGGSRVIYHWRASSARIYLLCIYAKNVRAALNIRELRTLRRLLNDL